MQTNDSYEYLKNQVEQALFADKEAKRKARNKRKAEKRKRKLSKNK